MTQVEARSRARHLSFQTLKPVRLIKAGPGDYYVAITQRLRSDATLIYTYRNGLQSEEVSCTARLLHTITDHRYGPREVAHLYARARVGITARTTDWPLVNDAIASRWTRADLVRVQIDAANLIRLRRVS